MYSLSHNFIFVHIGKNGGNTVSKCLEKYVDNKIECLEPYQDGIDMFDVVDPNYGLSKHSSLSEYKQRLPEHFYLKAFKFAVVRNPFDRLVSAYFSKHRAVRGLVQEGILVRDDFASVINSQRTFRQFTSANPSDSHAPLADDLNFVVRFENFEEDILAAFQLIGLPILNIPHINVSPRNSDYRQYYTPALRSMVALKFSEEIDHFGYEY